MAIINLTQGNDNFYDDFNSNQINGRGGVDLIYGGLGDDVIDSGAQTTYRQTINTTVSGVVTTTTSTINPLDPTGGDYVDGGEGNDTLYGADGQDQLFGADGADRLYGGRVSTLWQGHLSTQQNAQLLVSVDQTFVMIGSGQDQLYGGRGDDLMDGGDGHDLLQGGTGADTIYGGDGYVDLHLKLSKPAQQALTDIYYGQSSPVYISGGDDQLAGQAGDDVLDGRDGNDVIAGGSDQDRLYGGQGRVVALETRYYGTSGNSQVGYNTRGTRLIRSTDVYISGGHDQLYGGDGHDELNGQDGDDQLYGGAGQDRLYGGTTSRIQLNKIVYRFQHTTSNSSKEIYSQLSTSAFIADGSDQLYGGEGEDQLYGGDGHDQLDGGSEADQLFGGAGNDQLDGGLGGDKMAGGKGDDVYVIDDRNDRIYEKDNEGNDRADVSVNYLINQSVERVYVTGNANIEIIGNAQANIVYGNAAQNLLIGNAGDDLLYGGLGNDQLYGGLGDDRLDGGLGVDLMVGSFGNDTYMVNQADDQVIELDGQGIDTIHTTFDYQLSDFVENLLLEGVQDLQGRGNVLSNILSGNQGHNILFGYESNDVLYGADGNDQLDAGTGFDRLFGGAGDDILKGSRDDGFLGDIYNGIDYFEGGAGNDSYYIFHDFDQVIELADQGVDTVYTDTENYTMGAHIENVYLTFNGRNVTGNEADNRIFANHHNNILRGGAGFDVLSGGLGADSYWFGRGSERDVIIENDPDIRADKVFFDHGVRREDLWFSRAGDDLKIQIMGTADVLQVRDWFVGRQHQIEQIAMYLEAGSYNPFRILSAVHVEQLVNAMASLTPMAQGQTELSAAQKTALQPLWSQIWS